MSIHGIGEATAVTWVLKIGDFSRFGRREHTVSFFDVCGAQKELAVTLKNS